ncbi:MAG: hypothetical protein CMJ78_21885 [Planctomycetaceae bacterium]|nr:hypothetical protein [Planctomycetaceae bacterium]
MICRKSHNCCFRHCAGIVLLICLNVTTTLQADDNLLVDGEFKSLDSDHWLIETKSGSVRSEQVGGRWLKNSFVFNSGIYGRIRIGFYMAPGANGSVWIDNIRSEPRLPIINASFENYDKKRGFAGWTMTNRGTLSDATDRSSDGKRSFKIKYQAAEPTPSRIIQYVTVSPNTNYKIDFDVYLGNDFLGALRPNIYAGIPAHPHITGPEWSADDIVNERGKYATRVGIQLQDGFAALSQQVKVRPNRNLEFSVAVRTKMFQGNARLEIRNAETDKMLGSQVFSKTDSDWNSVRFRFTSQSSKLIAKLSGDGKGSLKFADARLETPALIPRVQKIEWNDIAHDFASRDR